MARQSFSCATAFNCFLSRSTGFSLSIAIIMSFFKAVAALGALSGALGQAGGQVPCTDAFRSKELNGVAPAFSNQTPGATAAFLQQLPLAPDATLTLYKDPSRICKQRALVTNTFAGTSMEPLELRSHRTLLWFAISLWVSDRSFTTCTQRRTLRQPITRMARATPSSRL